MAQAKDRLDIAFAMLDQELANKTWAMGDMFSMADCAAGLVTPTSTPNEQKP